MGAFGVEGIKTVCVNGASIAYRHRPDRLRRVRRSSGCCPATVDDAHPRTAGVRGQLQLGESVMQRRSPRFGHGHARSSGQEQPQRLWVSASPGNPRGIYRVVPWSGLGDGVDYLPCSDVL